MAGEIIHTTSILLDNQILRLVSDISKLFGGDPQYMYGRIAIPSEAIGDFVGTKESHKIRQAQIHTTNNKFIVTIARGASTLDTNGNPNIHSRTSSPHFDEIIVSTGQAGQQGQESPSPAEISRLEDVIAEHTEIQLPERVKNGADGAIQLLQKEMSALAKFHRQMLTDAENQRLKLDEDYRQKHHELEVEISKKREQIEEFSFTESNKIKILRDELAETKKRIDDRDHMHVRRELREQITTGIQNRVSKNLVPVRSQLASYLIFIFTFGIAVFAAFVSYESITSFITLINSETKNFGSDVVKIDWLIWMWAIRAVVASAVSLGFFSYAIGWLRKTYMDDVRTSNELQRYSLDINRASWTIETIMEMTTKEGRVLPDRWIEGACNGLFQSPDSKTASVSPLQAWGALLNVTGKAELGPEGPKLEFSKGQTSKIARSAAD